MFKFFNGREIKRKSSEISGIYCLKYKKNGRVEKWQSKSTNSAPTPEAKLRA